MQVIGTSAFISSFISAYCARSRTGTPTTVTKMKAACVFLAALSSVALADEPVPATALGNWAGKHSQSFALANASDPNRYVVEAGVSRSRRGTCAPHPRWHGFTLWPPRACCSFECLTGINIVARDITVNITNTSLINVVESALPSYNTFINGGAYLAPELAA